VVSAIGHEPDTPLLDLVADHRASTPTDAAKSLVPDVAEELHRVHQLRDRARHHVTTRVRHESERLAQLRARPVLADPRTMLDDRSREVADLVARARRCHRHRLERASDEVRHAQARVRALSPMETLRRGYTVLQDADGHVVTSVATVAPKSAISVRVADGRVHATTTRTERLEETADG
jgi:exodeoxyribonuclease VII large subunit